MTCSEFSNLLDAYLDNALPKEDAQRLEEHMQECPDCAMLLTLCRDARASGNDVAVPEEFSAAWRQGIREEERMEKRLHRRNAWKTWVAAAAALVFVVGGTLLTREPMLEVAERGSGNLNGAVMYDFTAADYGFRTAGATASNFSFESPQAARSLAVIEEAEMDETAGAAEQKIIRTASFTIRTAAYDQTLDSLQALIGQVGGRAEYMSQNGDAASGEMRTASFTLRIPADKLDEFLAGAGEIGSVTSLTQQQEDVSDSYYDLEARLQTQQTKMERLQALLAQAETVAELIELEDAIANTQYFLDSYTGSLQNYDSRIAYSTVRVSLREITVTESQEVTLGQRILAGLSDSLRAGAQFILDAMVFLVAALPWIAAVAVVIVVAVLIGKGKKRKEDK